MGTPIVRAAKGSALIKRTPKLAWEQASIPGFGQAQQRECSCEGDLGGTKAGDVLGGDARNDDSLSSLRESVDRTPRLERPQ